MVGLNRRWTVPTLRGSDSRPPPPAEDQREHEQDQEDEQQDLGDQGESAAEPHEAEDAGGQGEDREDDGPVEHGTASFLEQGWIPPRAGATLPASRRERGRNEDALIMPVREVGASLFLPFQLLLGHGDFELVRGVGTLR